MTLKEAAALLGVAASTLRHQIANGKLRATKRGRDWWVTRREVERYRRENRQTKPPEPFIGSDGMKVCELDLVEVQLD